MSRPPKANDPSESPQPELFSGRAYAVIIHLQDATYSDEDFNVAGVYMSFKNAVSCLKNRRLQIEDGWIAPDDAASRDQHPFRNEIGELRKDDGTLLGWDYSWRNVEFGTDSRLWIQETTVWSRGDCEDHRVAELSEEERRELQAEGDIDYVAFGQRVPRNSMFDEASRDLVFKGEKAYVDHDGETVE